LVLPSDVHFLGGASDFAREHAWSWRRFYFARETALEQQELADWAGVSPGEPLPAATNRYLFSALGMPQSLQANTARRTWIVLVGAGVVLLGGLLAIHFPFARQPQGQLIAAVVLVVLALVYPDAAFLLSVAALGLVLVVVAGLLRRLLGTSRSRRVVVHGGSSLVIPGSRTTERFDELQPSGSARSRGTSTVAVPTSGYSE